MILLAPAKVNLTLQITGRDRKDGYHFIKSVFDPVSLYDVIEISVSKKTGIKVIDVNKKLKVKQKDNMVYKAAKMMLEEAGKVKNKRMRMGIRIRVYKYIPHGAGLGGGSSDAAAVITGMNRLFKLKIPAGKMEKIGFQLGSDVPFFIRCSPAVVGGKGEKIRRFEAKKTLWYVIACPEIKVNTADAYREFDKGPALTRGKPYNNLLVYYLKGKKKFDNNKKILYNSFSGLVFKRHVKIKKIKEVLENCGAENVSLSGSGSAVFAVFETKKQALRVFKRARGKLKKEFMCMAHSV